jgi:hypothetical protein
MLDQEPFFPKDASQKDEYEALDKILKQQYQQPRAG